MCTGHVLPRLHYPSTVACLQIDRCYVRVQALCYMQIILRVRPTLLHLPFVSFGQWFTLMYWLRSHHWHKDGRHLSGVQKWSQMSAAMLRWWRHCLSLTGSCPYTCLLNHKRGSALKRQFGLGYILTSNKKSSKIHVELDRYQHFQAF